MLRTLIQQEIEEASTTANVPGYMTPHAFSGKGKWIEEIQLLVVVDLKK